MSRRVANSVQNVFLKSNVLESADFSVIDDIVDVSKKFLTEFGGRIPSPEELANFYLKYEINVRQLPYERIMEISNLISVLGEERVRDIFASGLDKSLSSARYKSLLDAVEKSAKLTEDEKKFVINTITDELGIAQKDYRSMREIVAYLQRNHGSLKEAEQIIGKIFEGLNNKGFERTENLLMAYRSNIRNISKSALTYFNTGRIIEDEIYRKLANVNEAWENSPFLKGTLFGTIGAKIPELRSSLVLIDRAYRNFMSLWVRATLARFPSWVVFNYLSNLFIYVTMAGRQSEIFQRLFRFLSPDTAKKIIESIGLPSEDVAVIWDALRNPVATDLTEGESAILFGKNLFRMNIFEHLRTVYRENQLMAKSLLGKFSAALKTLPDTIRAVNASIESYARLVTYYEFFSRIAKENEKEIRNYILRVIGMRLENFLEAFYKDMDEKTKAELKRLILTYADQLLSVSGFNVDRLAKSLRIALNDFKDARSLAFVIANQVGESFELTTPNSVTLKLLDLYLDLIDEAAKQGKALTPELLDTIQAQIKSTANVIANELAATRLENVLGLIQDDLEISRSMRERAAKKAVEEGKQLPRKLTPEQQVKAFEVFSEALDDKGNILDEKIAHVIKNANDETLEFISDISGIPKDQLANFSRLKKSSRSKIVDTLRGILDSNRIEQVMEREEVAEEAVEQAKKEVSEVTVTFGAFLNEQYANLSNAVSGTQTARLNLSDVLGGGTYFIDNSPYNDVYQNLVKAFDILTNYRTAVQESLQQMEKFDEEALKEFV
ncbi:MAG: hypothetical protein ACPLPV_00145, partial [Methanomassiliicoccales archaeon]